MNHKNSLIVLLFIVFSVFSSQKTFSQCIDIESILVGACSSGTNEGFNEMVRFKIGPVPQNINNLVVTWPNLTWRGIIQSPATQAKVDALNVDIIAAGVGLCSYRLKEPPGGIIPANASVILVTSYLMDTTLNTFGVLTSDIYIIFQDNPTVTTGHFANSGTGIRSLSMTFGGPCSDTVSYDRSLLVSGTSGSDGATVLYDTSGTATYVNNGCVAPVPLFTVDAGTAPSVCPGVTISLSGTVEGQQSVAWSAPSGSFSSLNTAATSYTVGPGVTGNVVLTLTATNSCGLVITDTVTLNVAATTTPTFAAVPAICSGATLAALPSTSTNSITGTWSPSLNNLATTIYTFVPATGQCAISIPLTITVNPNITPTFIQVPAVCSGAAFSLPATSTNSPSIAGTWSPAIDNTRTIEYIFTATASLCTFTAAMTVTVNPNITPTFTQVPAVCSGAAFSLPATSSNSPSIAGTWSPAIDNTRTIEYTFTATASLCTSTAAMTVTVNPKVTPTFAPVPAICSGAAFSLPTTSTNTPPISGTWSPVYNNLATTAYIFAPAIGQCAVDANLSVTVQPAVDFTISGACEGTDYVLRMISAGVPFNPTTTFIWQNSANTTVGTNDLTFNASSYLNSITMPLPQVFQATVTDSNGCFASKPFTVASLFCSIQKGISPNGDGDNEFFDLHLLDVKALSVFNRYGVKVYSKSNYRDEWRGETDGGNELPDGTYYYVIELNSNPEAKTGWVYINK
jgi:gliding motility-associated-like protein